jgi:hypothetical protein
MVRMADQLELYCRCFPDMTFWKYNKWLLELREITEEEPQSYKQAIQIQKEVQGR